MHGQADRFAAVRRQPRFEPPAARRHQGAAAGRGDMPCEVQARLLDPAAFERGDDLKKGEVAGKSRGLDAFGPDIDSDRRQP